MVKVNEIEEIITSTLETLEEFNVKEVEFDLAITYGRLKFTVVKKK